MDAWGVLLLIVALGMWMGVKLTFVGLLSLGVVIVCVTVFWAWRGYFTKGSASFPAILAVLGLWMGWGVGMVSATPGYWAVWQLQIQPVVAAFLT